MARYAILLWLPILLGSIYFLTGQPSPFTAAGCYLVIQFIVSRQTPDWALISFNELRGTSWFARWWNRRRRFGFFASWATLLSFSSVWLRSALSGTWGGGDLMLAVLALIPVFIILRRPPAIVDGFGRSKRSLSHQEQHR
jgi:hypothetical protein